MLEFIGAIIGMAVIFWYVERELKRIIREAVTDVIRKEIRK